MQRAYCQVKDHRKVVNIERRCIGDRLRSVFAKENKAVGGSNLVHALVEPESKKKHGVELENRILFTDSPLKVLISESILRVISIQLNNVQKTV